MSAKDHPEGDFVDAGPDEDGLRSTAVANPSRVSPRVALLVLTVLLVLAAAGGYELSEAFRSHDARRTAELDAIESSRAKLRRDPEDARAQLELAAALTTSGRLTSALAEYDTLLKQYPQDIAALYGRGALLMRLGRPRDAEAALLKVLAQDRGHVRAAEDLGDYYASRQQYLSLVETVRPSAELHPTEARLQYLLGLAYEHLDKPDLALSSYRLALAAVPDMPEALAGVQRLTAIR